MTRYFYRGKLNYFFGCRPGFMRWLVPSKVVQIKEFPIWRILQESRILKSKLFQLPKNICFINTLKYFCLEIDWLEKSGKKDHFWCAEQTICGLRSLRRLRWICKGDHKLQHLQFRRLELTKICKIEDIKSEGLWFYRNLNSGINHCTFDTSVVRPGYLSKRA